MRRFVEMKTTGGTTFQGWAEWVEYVDGHLVVSFEGGRTVTIPKTNVEYYETVPEGHPSIPAIWAKQPVHG